MLYREIIAVCSQIHTKHINTLCGQKVEFFSVKSGEHKLRLKSKKPNIFRFYLPNGLFQTHPTLQYTLLLLLYRCCTPTVLYNHITATTNVQVCINMKLRT
jgi:hypothetical protein